MEVKDEEAPKRQGGQLTGDGYWLVLTESTTVEEGGELKGYIHNPCGELIMAFIDYRPIWDGPFPCSGSGRVKTELIPYCPKCEEQPTPQGPIDLREAIWGKIGGRYGSQTG